MNFPQLGISRHVLAFMCAFVIIIFGIVSWFLIGVEESPNVDFPYITVYTTSVGSDSELVDNTVTSVLLDRLNGISGLSNLSGQSRDGISIINMEFELGEDINEVFNDVQVRVNQSLSDLPDDVDPPRIVKMSDSSDPFLILALYGDRTSSQLTEYAEDNIVPIISNVSGVSQVSVYGSREREVLISLDTDKMAILGVGVNDIINTFTSYHIQVPGGFLVSEQNDISLQLDFEFRTINDLKHLIIKQTESSFIRLQDIANVSYAPELERSYSSFYDNSGVQDTKNNADTAILLGIMKVSGANTFEIERNVQRILNENIVPNLEAGITLKVVVNNVRFIRSAVSSLEDHLIEGVFITALIVFLFLVNLRSTLIIAFAIPISLLGAIVVMYMFGYTFNILTLLALLLLIGIVVDDAIIVLENIYKKIEQGMPPHKAADVGSNEIVFAVLASTISLVSIFGPVAFMGGIVGRFFQSFAVVVTFGVLISYFVSLFITPMLCSRYLRYKDKRSKFFTIMENIYTGIENIYSLIITKILRSGVIIRLSIIGIAFIGGFFLVKTLALPVEFAPEEDYSLMRITVEAPTSQNIYYTMSKLSAVRDILSRHKEVQYVASFISNNTYSGTMFVTIVPIEERSMSQSDMVDLLRDEVRSIVGVKVRVSPGRQPAGGPGASVSFTVTANNLDSLYEHSTELLHELEQKDYINTVDYNLNTVPRIKLLVDKDLSSILGISTIDVARMLNAVVNGATIGKFNENGSTNRYDVKIRADGESTAHASKLLNTYYISQNDNLVKLSNFVKSEETYGYTSIYRTGSLYSTTMSIDPDVKYGAGDVTNRSIAVAKQILPPDFTINAEGNSRELQRTIVYVFLSFGLSIVLLYMVLASQFNSFIQPFALMAPIPIAVFGALLSLYVIGSSLNIYSMIGMILLVGLVVKNSILLVDLTNQHRKEGYTIVDALIAASPRRLRPILMTSFTVIFTMLPAVFGTAEGSRGNASLASVIVGGMLFSTLLTLIVIPILYMFIENMVGKIKRWLKLKDNYA